MCRHLANRKERLGGEDENVPGYGIFGSSPDYRRNVMDNVSYLTASPPTVS